MCRRVTISSTAAPIGEGSTATVTFTNISSLSGVTTAGDFTYLYDFDNTGNYVAAPTTIDVTAATASATVPASFLMTPGSHVVNGEIIDQFGGKTFASTTIQVNYVPPTLTLSGIRIRLTRAAKSGICPDGVGPRSR